MTNQIQNTKNKIYELEGRTGQFGEEIIRFIRTVKQDIVSKPILSQLVRSATSIGANYCEADGAESKKDFQHKIGICKKECKETQYWLQLIDVNNNTELDEERSRLLQESKELTKIFGAILEKSK